MFDLESRTVEVGTGVKLAITEMGHGGRPLLLIHGFTGAKEDFADHLAGLADTGWWVVAADNRGHGASDKPSDESAYSFETFADDVIGLVEALGWKTFALLGHSMGGMVAQVVAARMPDRIERLILMDTAHGPVKLAEDDMAAAALHIVRTQGMEALADAMAAVGDDPLTSPAYLRLLEQRPGFREWTDRKLRTTSASMYAAMLPAFGAGEDRLDSLRALTMPALVIVGEQDEPFLKPSRQMVDALPNGTLAVIPDAGHNPQFENPNAWWNAVSAFLAS